MKIAVFGSTGQLGSNLLKLYTKQKFDVRGYSRSHKSNLDSTINNTVNFHNLEQTLKKEFQSWIPDIIINTIAIVNLQKCEEKDSLANYVNVEIAKTLSSFSKKINSYFIHVSTDHFYNDSLHKHTEKDSTILLNNYAVTKYKSEVEVLNTNNLSLVVRTNIIGFRSNDTASFFEWLLHSLKMDFNINLFSNVHTSPISVKLLGNYLIQCYHKNLYGIYNIASSEVISKYDFGVKVAKKFNLNLKNINKAMSQKEKTLTRAFTLGLDVTKIENALNTKMPTVDESILNLYQEYKDANNE